MTTIAELGTFLAREGGAARSHDRTPATARTPEELRLAAAGH